MPICAITSTFITSWGTWDAALRNAPSHRWSAAREWSNDISVLTWSPSFSVILLAVARRTRPNLHSLDTLCHTTTTVDISVPFVRKPSTAVPTYRDTSSFIKGKRITSAISAIDALRWKVHSTSIRSHRITIKRKPLRLLRWPVSVFLVACLNRTISIIRITIHFRIITINLLFQHLTNFVWIFLFFYKYLTLLLINSHFRFHKVEKFLTVKSNQITLFIWIKVYKNWFLKYF